MSQEDALKRAIAREKRARQDAESLLEQKSLELWDKNQELEQINANLALKVREGRKEMERISRFPVENPQPVLRTSLNGEIGFSNQPFRDLAAVFPQEISDLIALSAKVIQGVGSKSLDFSFGEKHYTVDIVQIKNYDYINFYFTDITPLRKATEVIKYNEEKYRGVIESIELGILELDHLFVVTKVYPKVLEINGFLEDEVLGRPAFELFSDLNVSNGDVFKGGVVEVRARHGEGKDVWVRVSSAPLQNVEGENVGYIAVVQDVSEAHLRYDELKAAQLQAEESGKAKERFLANMSHELRTPMNAISGMAELLNENIHTEREQKYIQTIIKATNNLLVVLDDVLHLSKIEAGQLEIEIRETSLFELIDHVKTTMSMKALEKDLSFSVDLDEGIREVVKSDSVRLGQVLLNLVSNAIKFTKKGFVKVKVLLLDEGSDYQNIRFVVQDSGIGIKEENLEKIFQAFAQADNSIERKFGGTGLGLAISKQIVASLGGLITVQSIPEMGTSFSFDLRFKLGQTLRSVTENVKLDESKMNGLDVILAEDNEFNGLLIQ
jgi:PAS domain S-box-containing protein